MAKSVKALLKDRARAQEKKANARYYNVNSILGNDWAIFYCIIGSRATGKSYALTDFLCRQKKQHGDMCKNYWMRISESSTKAMLANKADKLVDPDLKRKYDLELTTKDCEVYDHGKPFMTVLPLSKFGKLKGVGFYDYQYQGFYNIVLDEFQLEIGEKRTQFDILYNFMGMIENLVRTTKTKLRIFLVGNTLEEASTILKAFNFLPHKFGRFYLKSKRCVIDNLEPTEEYLKDRSGSASDILGGRSMSNYTNALTKDRKLLTDRRRKRPTAIIKFSKDPGSWYSVWDGDIICRYKNEKVAPHGVIAMRPYLNEHYSMELRKMVIEKYDACGWLFKDLISQAYFQGDLEKVRKGV